MTHVCSRIAAIGAALVGTVMLSNEGDQVRGEEYAEEADGLVKHLTVVCCCALTPRSIQAFSQAAP